ncbi:hypothetical protein LPB72_01865 [Hydrogenophaga crassostreae]|uniref:2Fe-2S ferredoxin-type domain-containing protein n=2 Tax=Hydrogenophaga crassostreae TaxID=1763535 RepID=A0A162N1L0_9BURK|nr:hypothetical protein [Hydrogenophaga crassostreae]AOW13782.1 hypothetical protein LPB072_13960 [Hydrogenophaga crassostreae]OAD44255.1 hypothetical protein LPB72_01865 [Hydrogenophaga crassostreae]
MHSPIICICICICTCTCGAPRYMDGVFAAATAKDWPEDRMHREYINVPEAEAWVNQPFKLKLKRSGRTFDVPTDSKTTEVLAAAGLGNDVKRRDVLCGVCATGYDAALSGEVAHRDCVLSKKDRQNKVILCCSRLLKVGVELVLDL